MKKIFFKAYVGLEKNLAIFVTLNVDRRVVDDLICLISVFGSFWMYFSRPTRRMYVGGWVDVPKTSIFSRPTRRIYGGLSLACRVTGPIGPESTDNPRAVCVTAHPPQKHSIPTPYLTHIGVHTPTQWRIHANSCPHPPPKC